MLIGWHVYEESRAPALLFLEVDGIGLLEAHTAGDGSLRLVPVDPPEDFDMGEHGRFEFEPLSSGHPLAPVLGSAVEGVRRVVWHGTDVGLELVTSSCRVVIANQASEVFVSEGSLPSDYAKTARVVDV